MPHRVHELLKTNHTTFTELADIVLEIILSYEGVEKITTSAIETFNNRSSSDWVVKITHHPDCRFEIKCLQKGTMQKLWITARDHDTQNSLALELAKAIRSSGYKVRFGQHKTMIETPPL